MAVSLSTIARTAEVQAILTALGATGSKMKFFNGAIPAGVATPAGTLLATLNWLSVPMGTASAGGIAFDGSANMTQTSSGFTAGTPTFVQLTTSADVVHARYDLGGAPWTFAGTIAVSQNITLTSLTSTAGNP